MATVSIARDECERAACEKPPYLLIRARRDSVAIPEAFLGTYPPAPSVCVLLLLRFSLCLLSLPFSAQLKMDECAEGTSPAASRRQTTPRRL